MMNLSLCGCGFLGVYHLGVAACLREHGFTFLKSIEKVGGASAGSLIGCMIVADQSKLEDCIDFTFGLAHDIRKKALGALTPGYHILSPLQTFLEQSLPSDAFQRCSGKLYISVTNASTNQNEVVNNYNSNEELLQYLMASSHIPVYAGLSPVRIGEKKFIDGGMTDNLILFEEGRTVTISPFSGPQDICPRDKPGKGWYFHANNQDFKLNRKNMVRGLHAMFPPKKKSLQAYLHRGYMDAEEFLRKEGLYENEGPSAVLKKYLKSASKTSTSESLSKSAGTSAN